MSMWLLIAPELERIAAAAMPFGFQFRHVAGVDMLLDNAEPRASSGIHWCSLGEKVRPEYSEPVPGFLGTHAYGRRRIRYCAGG